MLTLEHIHTAFHKGTVDEMKLFEDFSFEVNKGDFISIVGSNGSGKTTLLNLICGTLQPDAGSIRLNGKDITHLPEFKRAKYIGRVFQDPKAGTCSNLTVLENFALADNKGKSFAKYLRSIIVILLICFSICNHLPESICVKCTGSKIIHHILCRILLIFRRCGEDLRSRKT